MIASWRRVGSVTGNVLTRAGITFRRLKNGDLEMEEPVMDASEKGRRGGKASGETRLKKGRESVLACKTPRELLAVVQRLERRAWDRGYHARQDKTKAGA
jgi:hypothetical protein